MKTPPVGAYMFHADGQTDITKQIVAFVNSANALPGSDQQFLSCPASS